MKLPNKLSITPEKIRLRNRNDDLGDINPATTLAQALPTPGGDPADTSVSYDFIFSLQQRFPFS